MGILKQCISILLTLALVHTLDYKDKHDALVKKEYSLSAFANVQLNEAEDKANVELMDWKNLELYSRMDKKQLYPFLFDFAYMKEAIKISPVYQIIKAMPKGALLHTHCLGMASAKFIFNLTYKENLWVCDDTRHPFELKYFRETNGTCDWKLVKDIRSKDPFYDIYLRGKLSYVRSYLTKEDMNDVQRAIYRLVHYKNNFEEFINQVISELYEDGIRYFEIRYHLDQELYDCDGNTYNLYYCIESMKNTIANFQKTHPDFLGLRLVYTIPRNICDEEFQEHLETYRIVRAKYGDFVAGIDFDNYEDTGRALKEFAPSIIKFRNKEKLDLFLHAGATGWYGMKADENLVDALLLGAKRIGHGWALSKHPLIMKHIKEKDICVEVAPLPDYYMYGFYTDVRNHPAAQFGAYNVQYVLSNGNPAFYESKGVNFDWYLALMGYSSGHDDLRFLKKLALNSIKYAAVTEKERGTLQAVFDRDWTEFIRKLGNNEIVTLV